jgi:hypothetical protein
MYSNVFDCITFTQVRQHLFICRLYFVVLISVKNLQVTWEPYETDEVKGMALNAICRCDQDLCTTVLPLICYYIVECHLPICVVCQFGELQTVDVQHAATSENLHK